MALRDLFKRKPADEKEALRFEVTSRTDDAEEATSQALETVREHGVDPGKPRATDFYLYLRTREGADAATDALRAAGYEINARPSADPESERPWLVVASRELVVGEASLEEAEAFLKQLAERHDGEYDGWETAVG
jgi:regulator of RNase E activity RraB